REPEEQEILDWSLPEIMVDAEYRRLVECLEQNPVELLCRGTVAAKWLFDDNAGPFGAARLSELFHDEPEEPWGNGEIICRPVRRAERLANRAKRCRVAVVAVNVVK